MGRSGLFVFSPDRPFPKPLHCPSALLSSPDMKPHAHLDVTAFLTVASMTIIFGAIWRPAATRLQLSDRWRHVGEAMNYIY